MDWLTYAGNDGVDDSEKGLGMVDEPGTKRLSYANVTATLALVMVITGTAVAANMIRSDDVVNGSIRGIDIRTGTLTGKHVNGDSIPRGDLSFDALSPRDTGLDRVYRDKNMTATTGNKVILIGKDIRLPTKSDTWGVLSVEVENTGATELEIEFRPFVDGQPHGNHRFTTVVDVGANEIVTVSFQCDFIPPGVHDYDIEANVVNGDGTFGNREYDLMTVPSG